MWAQIKRILLWVAVATVATVAGVGVAGASGHATGNAAIIKQYAKGVKHMNASLGFVETDRGQYYWGYSGSGWRLDLDSPKPPYPYEHAVNLVQTDAVSGGKVTWELNQFECPTAGSCGPSGSLSIYGTAHGVYYGTSSGAAGLPACWTRASGPTQWMVIGYSPGWVPWSLTTGAGFTAEHYVSMVRHGARDVFTSTYSSTSTRARYTEVDTLVVTSFAFVESTYQVTATPGHAAYSYSTKYSFPSSSPTPPTLTLCGAG
jgi:hypothetical protein